MVCKPQGRSQHRGMIHKVIFACVHNAARSQMAAAFFNHLADREKTEALSAGTEPACAFTRRYRLSYKRWWEKEVKDRTGANVCLF